MKLKLFILFILTFGLGANLTAQTIEFSTAAGSGSGSVGGFAKWNFEFGGNQFEISDKGKGKRANRTVFQLPKRADENVSRVYYTALKNDLVVLYEISAGGEGAGYAARFDGKTLKLKWKATISGFNVGKGLLENNFAYLTAIGFVGKLNLMTGKYVWKHDDLFSSKGAFNSFELPELEGGNVVFTEKAYDNSTNILVVNKTTGKIVRTILDKK